MSTVSVKGVKVKDGRLVRVKTYMAGKRKLKADRLAKQWAKKSPVVPAPVRPGDSKNPAESGGV